MKALVTFTLNFDYFVEGVDENECYEKALEQFNHECTYSYDEWDLEEIENDE